MGERVRPFAKGSEFVAWKRRNCERCTLKWQQGLGYQCDIESAVDYAYMERGMMTLGMAKRMKFDGEHVAEDCPERELEEGAGEQ